MMRGTVFTFCFACLCCIILSEISTSLQSNRLKLGIACGIMLNFARMVMNNMTKEGE